jgi:putative GTP pyrophosphokinase
MTDIRAQYATRRTEILVPLAERLEAFIVDQLKDVPRIDRISARAKSVERFVAKAEKLSGGQRKYDDPLNQIQDQIGARVVTFYLKDVDRVSDEAKEYFRSVEEKLIVPDSEREFDYVGKHFIMFIPTDVFQDDINPETAPKFFELQIKTLFQHAWSEANHDLGYKPGGELSKHQKRQIAFTSAQAWGADLIFDQLHSALSVE